MDETMKKHIPNTITMMNLFSGCIAIAMAFSGNFLAVVVWVVIAAVFDFFDGFAARMLGVSSKIGVELDSLADLTSFGVAPAAATFVLLRDFSAYPSFLLPVSSILPYTAFLLPVFSALRLAKFNLDDRQTTSFLGLPTPADALFWISYCYGVQYLSPINAKICYSTLGFIVIFSLLMVSEIPMFSLKIKKLQFSGNEKQALLIIVMIAFVAIWGIAGVAWGILFYILLSISENSFGKTKR
jgi:CDP-diacylglycerol--serine O-phosphatidyltransferase